MSPPLVLRWCLARKGETQDGGRTSPKIGPAGQMVLNKGGTHGYPLIVSQTTLDGDPDPEDWGNQLV